MIAPGVPKLQNYHPVYFEDPAKWSEMFSSIIHYARLQTESPSDSFPTKLFRFIKKNFFPKARLKWLSFTRSTVVREMAKNENQLVYHDDLIIRGTVNRTQRVPSNIYAFSTGVIVEIDTKVGELVEGHDIVGVIYFNDAVPDVTTPSTPLIRHGEFQLDDEYDILIHTVPKHPKNYHPKYLNPTQYNNFYQSMFTLLAPSLNQYLYNSSIPKLEPFFPGHVITTIRCPELTTAATVLTIDTPIFGAFHKGDALITVKDNRLSYTIEARHDGIVMDWKVGHGYRVAKHDTLGELLYFHPDKPDHLSYLSNEWFYSGSGDKAVIPSDTPPSSTIDLSDRIFDSEKPKATKSKQKNKKNNKKKKKKVAARGEGQKNIKEAAPPKGKSTFASKVSNDENERHSPSPFLTIMYKGNERQVLNVGSEVSNPANNHSTPNFTPNPPVEKIERPAKLVIPKPPKPLYPVKKATEIRLQKSKAHTPQTNFVKPIATTKSSEGDSSPRQSTTGMVKSEAARHAPRSVSEEPVPPHKRPPNGPIKPVRLARSRTVPTYKAPLPTSSIDSQSPRSDDILIPSTPSTDFSSMSPISPFRSDSLERSTTSSSPSSSDGRPSPPLTIPQLFNYADKPSLHPTLPPPSTAPTKPPHLPRTQSYTKPFQFPKFSVVEPRLIYRKRDTERPPTFVPPAKPRDRRVLRQRCLNLLGLNTSPSEMIGFNFGPPPVSPPSHFQHTFDSTYSTPNDNAPQPTSPTTPNHSRKRRRPPTFTTPFSHGVETDKDRIPILLSCHIRNQSIDFLDSIPVDYFIPRRNHTNPIPPIHLPYNILLKDLDRSFSNSFLRSSTALEILYELRTFLRDNLLPDEIVSDFFFANHHPTLSLVPSDSAAVVDLDLYPLYSIHTDLEFAPHLPCIVSYLPTFDDGPLVPAFHHLINRTTGEPCL